MSIDKKRSFIHRARKSENYSGDEEDKQKVITIIREEFGYHFVRPLRALQCLDGSYILPDLVSTDYRIKTYIELHGFYHNDIEDSTDYTYQKRKKYLELGLELIEIWKDKKHGYTRENVITRLESHGFTRIKK